MLLYFTMLLGLLSVVSAFYVVFARQVVHSALCLTVNLLCVALFYLALGLQFLAMAQLLIYAGAIMVLFLFAVTVLSPDEEKDLHTPNSHLFSAVLAGAVLAATLGVFSPIRNYESGANNPPFNIHDFAMDLFGRFVFPFEVTAFILLVALFGVVLLGHRRLKQTSSGSGAQS